MNFQLQLTKPTRMKFLVRTTVAAGLGIALMGYATADTVQPMGDKERLSYSIGLEVARNFKRNAVEVDTNMVMQGLNDGLGDKAPAISEKEFKQIIQDFQATVRQRMAANRQVQVVENRKRAMAFLAKNKGQDGVQELGNGVQFKVLKEGAGRKPADVDTVTIAYRGSLIDGSVFDSTEAGRPGRIRLTELSNGLRSALKLMPVGAHWQVWIPPPLGFGERGVGNDVGPNELLIYDIELLDTVSPDGVH